MRRPRRLRAVWLLVALGVLGVAMLLSLTIGVARRAARTSLAALGGGTDGFAGRRSRSASPARCSPSSRVRPSPSSGAVMQGVTRNPLADPGILGRQHGRLARRRHRHRLLRPQRPRAATSGSPSPAPRSPPSSSTPSARSAAAAPRRSSWRSRARPPPPPSPRSSAPSCMPARRHRRRASARGRSAESAAAPSRASGRCCRSSPWASSSACSRRAASTRSPSATSSRPGSASASPSRAGAAALGAVMLCGAATGRHRSDRLRRPRRAARLRLLAGVDHRWLLPFSAVVGAVLLTSRTSSGRIVARPAEIDVGIVTALIGAPFFIWIVRRAEDAGAVTSNTRGPRRRLRPDLGCRRAAVAPTRRPRPRRRGRRRRTVMAVLVAAVAVVFVVSLMVGPAPSTRPLDVLGVCSAQDVPGATFTVGRLRLPRAVLADPRRPVLRPRRRRRSRPCCATRSRAPTSSASARAPAPPRPSPSSRCRSTARRSRLSPSSPASSSRCSSTLLSYRGGVAGTRLILIGIGVAAMLDSLTAYVLSGAAQWDLQEATRWLTGSLNGASWPQVLPVLIALAVLAPGAARPLARPVGHAAGRRHGRGPRRARRPDAARGHRHGGRTHLVRHGRRRAHRVRRLPVGPHRGATRGAGRLAAHALGARRRAARAGRRLRRAVRASARAFPSASSPACSVRPT